MKALITGITGSVGSYMAEHLLKKKGVRVLGTTRCDKWQEHRNLAGVWDAVDATVRNLGDVRWCATEDGSKGKGTGRHIAAFILEPPSASAEMENTKLSGGGPVSNKMTEAESRRPLE